MNKFYVYAHFKPGESTPFYIGKGFGYRAYKKTGRATRWKNYVNKYGDPDVKLLYENLSEDEALKKETELIQQFGRIDNGTGPLINQTDGGDGVTGLRHSDEIKEVISKFSKERNADPQFRQYMRERHSGKNNPNYGGKHMTDEVKKRLSEKAKNRYKSDEERKKISESVKESFKNPNRWSAEVRKKMSDKKKAYWAKRRSDASVAQLE